MALEYLKAYLSLVDVFLALDLVLLLVLLLEEDDLEVEVLAEVVLRFLQSMTSLSGMYS